MTLAPGQLLDGKYEVRRLIGKGGMGNVYEGEHVLIHRLVAIKELNAKVANDPAFVMRFEREAQAAGRIGSDHIVEVLDLGTLDSGERYMVMEFLLGESLGERMQRQKKMRPEAIFPIVIGLLEGLSYAHAADIVHRDLKPANVWLSNDRQQEDFVKILDFGVSKFLELSSDDPTATGVTLGTPRYMAPEQAKGEKDVDFRADLYSVGVILFRALTGRPPFLADTYNELMFKVVLEDPPSLSELIEDADPTIVRLVAKSLERDRELRFQSADAMADELRAWLERHGHAVPVEPSARRQRLESSSTLITVPEFPIEPTSTKHAAAVVPSSPRAKGRRGVYIAAAVVFACVIAFTTIRVLQVVATESIEPSANVPSQAAPSIIASDDVPDPPETATPTATAVPEASAPPEPAPSASAVASASAAPSTSTAPSPNDAPAPTYNRPPTPPPPPPPSGPARRYRRKL